MGAERNDSAMEAPPRKLVNIEHVLENATLAEKISLLAGSDFWHSTPLPQYDVPAVKCTDGPNGVRGSRFFNPVPALCIPCGSGLGATWNPELIEQAGKLLSKECEAKGAHVWLGPTVNIIRSPLNGRGFESFSEDPHLSGILAGSIIKGVQSRGTLAALKHFVANDQETEKMSVDVCISDRALREIYLMPFQIALRDSKPRVVMSSYNKVQGLHVSESPKILQDILRKEWGFDGLIMSDWYGTYSCKAALNAGVDIEMPGPSRYRDKEALAAVFSGKVAQHTIDERARKVLEFVNDAALARVGKEETTRDVPEDRNLNRRLAGESIVLLKNEENILPLTAEQCDEVAVIGPNAEIPAACGGGSASLRPYYTSSVLQGIRGSLPPNSKVHHEPGVYGHLLLPPFTAEHVVNDTGLPGADLEKEGKDRRNMDLPPHVDKLISAVLEAQPDAIIVTQAGNPIRMPWGHSAKSMIHSWYGGNEAGNAVADVLFGRINPSGKLPMTFPDRLEDNPAFLSFGSDNGKVHYSEGVFVGYRWYETRRITPAFPFGHGLSYTTFDISGIQVSSSHVQFSIQNTGKRAGAEVIQMYIRYFAVSQDSRFARPRQELKGFKKIYLEPGERKLATIPIDKYSTAVWDEKRNSWCCEKGDYLVYVVSATEGLMGSFNIEKSIFWNGL
ncbi:putative beta-glucosidase K [Colletotrichum sp. SAR11_59]|nr:putative beta-glucosidase K [Colletotrichum sp. SAR11_59]